MEGVYRVIVEGHLNVHNLCHIVPEETMALTDIKVKALESLSSAVKQFKDIARRRMAGHDDLPSYTLWSQEHWTIEQSFYKLTSDEPKESYSYYFYYSSNVSGRHESAPRQVVWLLINAVFL